MENFEELIKDYVTKHVDANNPTIVEYSYIRKPRVSIIDLREPEAQRVVKQIKTAQDYKAYDPRVKIGRTPRQVRTPIGVFNTVREAARAIGISPTAVYQKLKQCEKKEIKEYELI